MQGGRSLIKGWTDVHLNWVRKESKIIRVKNQMSFIDLANNLSDKFYVSKAEQ